MPKVPTPILCAPAFAVLVASSLAVAGPAMQSYEDSLAAWRKEQTASLLAEEGWLNVTGLAWFSEGESTIGSSSDSKLILPSSAPSKLGAFTLTKGLVTFNVVPGAAVEVDGQPVTTVEMKPDTTRAKVGSITLMVIQRGKRIGLRMFDKNSKARREFKGQKWFAPNKDLRVSAKLVPYNPPRMMTIFNVIGDPSEVKCPGYLAFTVGGKECRLDVQPQVNGFFLNFADATSGKETYAAGRFLDVPKAVNGVYTIDFNQAVNPPCAFTEYATCPLPPVGNHLSVAINAGEKSYHNAEVDPAAVRRAGSRVPPQ